MLPLGWRQWTRRVPGGACTRRRQAPAATRRAQSIEAAKRILLEAVERLPKEPIPHYNLACYECQLGELEVAKARLAHAFELEPKCRLMALDDDDLAPLWDSLAG